MIDWISKLLPQPELRWPASITYEDITRIKENADVDLCCVYEGAPAEGEHALTVWEDMLRDVGVTVNVLRLWLGWDETALRRRSKQLTAAKISEGVQELEKVLDGFFLDLGRGPMFGMLCRVSRKQAAMVLEKTTGSCESQLENLLERTITEKFGGSLESPALGTPADTNTGNSTS